MSAVTKELLCYYLQAVFRTAQPLIVFLEVPMSHPIPAAIKFCVTSREQPEDKKGPNSDSLWIQDTASGCLSVQKVYVQ